MTDAERLIERLLELRSRATQGEWQLQDGCSWRRIGTPGHDGNVLCPDTYSRTDNHPDLRAGKGEDLYANLTLIVELVNGLPSISTLIQQQADRIVALEGALRPFAAMRKSTEAEVSDLVHRSPAEEMRRHAKAIEQRDAEIETARAVLGETSSAEGRG